jgi:hypothetical protein
LAWRLQAAAEKGSSSGAISENDLRALLTQYLKQEGHETDLVQDLFTGMVERVVALVSRVEGTFEFEVQPLREYFAARHLYETAPYSPPGAEKKGTTPERFAALAGNFYWLNVARFFSGCFSKGELTALADSLEELSNNEEMGLVEHPRLLALMLLGDWVFSQQPLAVQRVVSTLFKQPGFKILISSGRERDPNSQFVLPDKCGRSQVLDVSFKAIQEQQNPEDQRAYIGIILQNSSINERRERWLKTRAHISDDMWLEHGQQLLVIQTLPLSELTSLYAEFGSSLLNILAQSGRVDLIYQDETLFRTALDRIAKGTLSDFPFRRSRKLSSLEKLQLLLRPQTYRPMLNTSEVEYYQSIQKLLRSRELEVEDPSVSDQLGPAASQTRVAAATIDTMFRRPDINWSSSLEPWSELLNTVIATIGSDWVAARIAILSAGIRSTEVQGSWSEAKWQIDVELCSRIRFARLKSGNVTWWKQELELVKDRAQLERMVAIVTFLVWATPKTIQSLVKEISALTDELLESVWKPLFASCAEIMAAVATTRRADTSNAHVMSKHMSERVALSMTNRGNARVNATIYKNHFQRYDGTDPEILGFILISAIRELSEESDLASVLKTVRSAYRHGATPVGYYHVTSMPKQIATDICRVAQDYPEAIVRVAQRQLAADIGSRARKVSDIAEAEAWFSAD